MYRVKITAKGQLTVPKQLREALGLAKGDYLLIKETAGEYTIEKEVDINRFDHFVGLLGQSKSSDLIVRELRGE
ncbi:MAG: AbrB/MazE/SpoVT family DNA-binding domain-containing protein [Bacillota bacterium]|nr:AbrB/MazE/SpoVT family DNA-binding domain-containing protein [Bacillota bacterium]